MPRRSAPKSAHSPRNRTSAPAPAAPSGFARRVLGRIPGPPPSSPAQRNEPLAHLDYDAEVDLKNAALRAFWRERGFRGRPDPVVRSPRPRHYRTTTRRRVDLVGQSVKLFLGERQAQPGQSSFEPSLLEPKEHTAVYRFLQAKLSEPAFRPLAKRLGWLIVRGSLSERAVIFNVDALDATLVRRLKALGAELARHEPPVIAAFVYVDPSGSDYYFEARRPERGLGFKKLYGPDRLRVDYDGLRFAFAPTSFCQVNQSIVPKMLETAGELLAPSARDRFLDLYCGFGLFSIAFADRVREAIGVDTVGPSIEAARDNAQRAARGRVRFVAQRITAEFVDQLPPPTASEVLLLDPPRSGTEPGVIAALAERHPRRVLHIFCSVDELPRSLGEWAQGGYRPSRCVPLDMFPGTPNLELLVLLEPAS